MIRKFKTDITDSFDRNNFENGHEVIKFGEEIFFRKKRGGESMI